MTDNVAHPSEPTTAITTAHSPSPAVDRGVGGFFVSLCCALTALATLTIGWVYIRDRLPEPSQETVQIVTVDINRLLEAQTRHLIAQGRSAEDMSAEGIAFGKRVREELGKYAQAGVTVVAHQVVLATPVGRDVTHDVAKRVGVVLNEPTSGATVQPNLEPVP